MIDDFDGSYYTQAKTDKNVLIAGQAGSRELPGAVLFAGDLEVTEQVIAYQRRDMTDGHVMDTTTLDLPEQTFTTQAFWLAVPQPVLDRALTGLSETDELAAPGALHAAEHALIALLPLYAMCDRWDIGGLSTPWHWQTDTPSIFVYDGYPGGIGLSRRGLRRLREPRRGRAHAHRRVPLRERLPELRAEPQVRQPQRAAQQGRRRRAAQRGPELEPSPATASARCYLRGRAACDRLGHAASGGPPCPHDITIETLDPADIELVAPALEAAAWTTSPSLPDALVPVRPSDESWELERAEMLARAGRRGLRAGRAQGRARRRLRLRLRRGPRPRLVHRRQARRCSRPSAWTQAQRGEGIGGALMDAVDAELRTARRRGRGDRRGHRQPGRGAPLREPRLPPRLPHLLRLARRQAVGLPAPRGRRTRQAGRGRFAPPGPIARRTHERADRYVSVIGASRASAELAAKAEELGELLAARGLVVVCGGRDGVMEAVARGVKRGAASRSASCRRPIAGAPPRTSPTPSAAPSGTPATSAWSPAATW